jgi:type IV pilus assembly protein PilN
MPACWDTSNRRITDVRIPVNLASEPFRRDRPMLIASGAIALVLAVLLGALVFLMVAERGQVKETRVSVDRLKGQLPAMAAEQARLEATLRQPANAEVLQRSLLLNTLVERKSISWTRIFSDLEGVMPFNVRLISVRLPQITSQNEVVLDMVVGAKEPGSVIGFLKRLEESPRFGTVYTHNSLPPSQNDPLYRYRVTVNYAQKL